MLNNMTTEQEIACHAIIHSFSSAAGAVGFGLAQIQLADNVAISAIQMGMTMALGQVFGQHFTRSAAAAHAASKMGTLLGVNAAKALWGFFPGVGNALNAGTAGALTESLGWMLANEFAYNARSANKTKNGSQNFVFMNGFGF